MKDDTEALKALIALAKKATPGPVYTVVNSHDKSVNVAVVEKDYQLGPYIALLKITEACRSREDAAFIEAAYNAIPALERMLASQTQDMVLVPRDPTAEMLLAWQNSDGLIKAYHAMLAAAPVASQMGEPDVETKAREIVDELYAYRLINFDDIEETMEVTERHLQRLVVAAPAAGMDADKIARDIVETYICTKRAENYESSVAEIAAIIRRTVK